jgi:hypothetical protein
VRWDFTGADGLYGNSTAYRRGIDALALGEYVVDVHSDQTVYLTDPKREVPGAAERTRTCAKPLAELSPRMAG